MAAKPWNMRKGVTYYVTLADEKHKMIVKGRYLGKGVHGYEFKPVPMASDQIVMTIKPEKIIGCSAVKS
jgi:hypothetical protein